MNKLLHIKRIARLQNNAQNRRQGAKLRRVSLAPLYHFPDEPRNIGQVGCYMVKLKVD